MKSWFIKREIIEKYPSVVLNDKNEKTPGGLVLAYDQNRAYVDGSDSHTLIVGSTGSKKSRLIVMPTVISLLKAGENVIVSDPKKEIYDTTCDLAKKEGYKIITVDFRNPCKSSRWNPLEVLDEAIKSGNEDKIALEIRKTAESFIVIGVGKDPYWSKASIEFLENILYLNVIAGRADLKSFMKNIEVVENVLRQSEEKDPYSLGDKIYDIISKTTEKNRAKQIPYNKLREYGNRLKEFVIKWASYPNGTRGSVLATMSSNLQIFKANKGIIDNSVKPDFTYGDIIGKKYKTIVYLIIPEENSAYEMLVKMFVEQSYSYLISVIQDRYNAKAPRRINYILDEFANIPPINGFEKNISISRSRNIRFFLVVQDISQIEHRYGTDSAYTIVGNCNNIAYLYCNDVKTNSFIHDRVSDKISLSSMTALNPENGEVMFLLGRYGEYIGFLKDISSVMEMVNNG